MYDYSSAPLVLREFLSYMDTIKGKSQNTAKEYFYDLRTFFRFLKIHNGLVSKDTEFEDIPIDDVTVKMLSEVTLSDLYEYMAYTNRIRKNTSSSRARKVSSLKSFYKFLTTKKTILKTIRLKSLKRQIGKSLPRHLDLDSSMLLLSSAQDINKRDYCILTLLLNCGLRLSELIGINISDISPPLPLPEKAIKRTIYLNNACKAAITAYLEVRPKDRVKDRDAVFKQKQATYRCREYN